MAAIMDGDDLTGIAGFQSHCMASRYYKMAANLTLAKESTTDYNSFFTEFIDSLQLIGDKGPLLDDIAQAEKAKLFLNAAIKSLHKHFGRWCSVQLLPASLLAEQPLAACVARVILDKPPPVYIKPPKDSPFHLIAAYDKMTIFRSSAHKHTPFFLPSFEAFIQDRLDAWRAESGDTSAFNDSIKSAANSIIVNSIDFRDVNAIDPTPIQLHMWRTYLPLPHQTQSVERGVKESGLVAATGRGEEARSCWATVRDDLALNAGIDRETTNEARIKLLFQGAVDHVTKQEQLKLVLPDYDTIKSKALLELKDYHFKKERQEKLVVEALEKADKNKKTDNARQKAVGVDLTVKSAKLISYSSIHKSPANMAALKTELEARGFTGWTYPEDYAKENKRGQELTFTDLRGALKSMEIDRVSNAAPTDTGAKSNSKRAFQKQSGAEFVVTEK